MVRSIPKVCNDSLQLSFSDGSTTDNIQPGSAEWYVWLEHSQSFRFETSSLSFTARQEQRPGGRYWYAYRRRHGKLRIAYLGKSSELSIERLNAVAAFLAEDSIDDVKQHSTHKMKEVVLQETPITAFPEVRTTSPHLPQHNLPAQLTSLVGREPAIATATALLRSSKVRLLNMIGTGGIGKTRMAIAVATALLEDFHDGIYFVALTPIHAAALVLPTIAHTLHIQESGNGEILELIKSSIGSRQMLLILDNFEHVLTSTPQIEELLMNCPGLKLLVTSREVLHLPIEQPFSIPPLALPDLEHVSQLEILARYPSVQLFVQRVQAVKPNFQLHEANASFVAKICTRLDGLPLAIELAATRMQLLSTQALLSRLDSMLHVLSSRGDHLPERQQTLRNLIQWSYELLNSKEQQLFRRLSVFAGLFTLEAIEAICAIIDNDTGEDVLEDVQSLIDKSLLQQTADEEPYLYMLEAVRAFALEELTASGEIETICHAHTLYFLKLVEEAEPQFWGPQQAVWLNRLEKEYSNLRAALHWLLEHGDIRKHVEIALRLGGALWWFWYRRGYFIEGAAYMEKVVALADDTIPVHVRAKAFRCTGHLVATLGNNVRGDALLLESVILFQACNDRVEMGRTYFPFGMIAAHRRDLETARLRYEEGLSIAREMNDTLGLSNLLHTLGNTMRLLGEYDQAYALFKESLALFKASGNKGAIASSRLRLAELLFMQNDISRACTLAEIALSLHKELGDSDRVAETLELLGQIALHQHDATTAHTRFQESLSIWTERISPTDIAGSLLLLASVAAYEHDYLTARILYEESLELLLDQPKGSGREDKIAACLEGFAVVCASQKEFDRAICLWSVAEALREAILIPIPPVARTAYEYAVNTTRTEVGEKYFVRLWAKGRAMTPQQALAVHEDILTLKQAAKMPDDAILASPSPGLTRRESDVLCFLTKGLTSTQIARELFISLSTVNTHIRSIYNKLGVTSRSAATRYALEQHLV